MKKCTLTQVPCRKAIMEVVEANKKQKIVTAHLRTGRTLSSGLFW